MTDYGQDPMIPKLIELNERLIAQGLMGEDELTGDDFESIVVPTQWKLYVEFTVTAEMNELYGYTLRDPNSWYQKSSPYGGSLVHPIALVQLGTRPVLAKFGVNIPEGESSLHAKMEIEFVAPAFVGDSFKEEGRLASKYVRRGRRYLVTEGRFLDPTGQVVVRYAHTRMVGRDQGGAKS